MKTIVIFRKWPNGDIIALFPQEPGDTGGRFCQSYEHIGQHGAADAAGVVTRTKPATDAERADLKAELERIGYQLEERQRIPRNSFAAMRAALRAMRAARPLGAV